jgi:NTP pyrophosphatase (non-canonical NTP hydrolase)
MMEINEYVQEVYQTAKSKGFYSGDLNIYEELIKIHGEVTEAAEAVLKDRKPVPDHVIDAVSEASNEVFYHAFDGLIKGSVEEELADIALMVLSLSGVLDINLQAIMKLKMRYNKMRPVKKRERS